MSLICDRKLYFKEARDWYYKTYFYRRFEKVWSFLLCIFLFLPLFCSFFNLYMVFPVKKNFPLVVSDYIHDDEYPLVKKLNTISYDDFGYVLSEYLVNFYIKKAESYKYDDIEEHDIYLKNNSSREVYFDLINKFNSLDKNSYLSRYGINGVREVEIVKNDVNINKSDGFGSAVIKYKYTVYGVSDKVISGYESVSIDFTISDVKSSIKRGLNLEFVVNKYVRL